MDGLLPFQAPLGFGEASGGGEETGARLYSLFAAQSTTLSIESCTPTLHYAGEGNPGSIAASSLPQEPMPVMKGYDGLFEGREL